ncbi:peptide-aspartate beta-dioxygenase [Aureococcus anophagefferens]|uniref:Peptide-aspartate beta-dioxygenase n=1 Tax=Aureococcus anophagefferens TaxID=44056 RepID=A0ABR1FXM2_AURAN
MVKPRILSAWTPSKRRVREDLEMHLEEAEQQLEQQRREGERLRRVKDAFDASLELRSRELELALEDVAALEQRLRARKGETEALDARMKRADVGAEKRAADALRGEIEAARARATSSRAPTGDWLVIHAKNATVAEGGARGAPAPLPQRPPGQRPRRRGGRRRARDADEPAGATLPWGARRPPLPAPAPAPAGPGSRAPAERPAAPRSDPPPPSRATVGPIAEIPPFRGGAPADEPAPSRPPPTTKLAEIPPFRPRDEPPIHEEENVEEPGVDEDVDADRCTYHVKFRPGADPYEVAAKLFAVAAVADAGVVWDLGSVVANAGDNRFLVTCTLPEDVSRDFMYRELQRSLVPLSGRSMGLVTFVDLAYDWDEPDPAKEIVTLDAAKLAALVDREQREPSAQLGASRGSDASDDFGARLARAGLGSVAEGLRAEGVDDLQTLAKMTEAEVDALARDLGLKVGFAVKLKGLRAEAVARKRLSQAPSRHSVMSQFDLEPLAPGARVLARHGDDAFFSEGAVEAVDGESYGVRFDFGAVGDDIPRRRIFTANQVQDAALPVGETVDALVDGEDDARVATATVVAVDGDAYHVVFEDPELGEASLTRDQVWGAFHDRPAVDPAALLLDDPPSPLKMSPRDDPAAEEPEEPEEEPEEPDAEEDPEPAEAPPRPGDLVAVPGGFALAAHDHDHDHENAPAAPEPEQERDDPPSPQKPPPRGVVEARRWALVPEAAAVDAAAVDAVLADWGVIAPDDDVAVRAEATAGGLALVAEASVAGFPWAWLDEQLQDRFAEFPDVLKSLALQPADQSPRDKSPRRGGAVSAPTRALSPRADNSPRRDAASRTRRRRSARGRRRRTPRSPTRRRARDAVVSAPTRALSPRADNSPRRDAVVPDAAPAEPRGRPEKENAPSPTRRRGARRRVRADARAVAARRQLAAARRARARRGTAQGRAARRRLAAPRRRAAERRAAVGAPPEQGTAPAVAAGPAPEPLPADYLAPGARVECRYMATSEFYGGVVASYVNGRYTVEYDDMGTEHGVDRLRLRLPGQAMAPPAVDAVVDAWHPGSNCVRRASVVGLGASGSRSSSTTTASSTTSAAAAFGAFLPPGLVPEPAAPSRPPPDVVEPVEGPDAPASPDVVEDVEKPGVDDALAVGRRNNYETPKGEALTFDNDDFSPKKAKKPVLHDHHAKQAAPPSPKVAEARGLAARGAEDAVREAAAGVPAASPSREALDDGAAPLAMGAKVLARYGEERTFYPAVVTGVHARSYAILFDDGGDRDDDARGGGSSSGPAPAAEEPAAEEPAAEEPAAEEPAAEEPAAEEPAAATPAKAAAASPRPAAAPLEAGAAVFCRFQQDAEFYPATVVRDNGDGTYAVLFDDGDEDDAANRRAIYRPGQQQHQILVAGERIDVPAAASSPRSLESHEHHLMASDADHPTSPHAGAFDDVDKQSHISSAAFSEHMEAQFDDAFDAFNDQEGFPPDSASSGGFDRGEDRRGRRR